MIIKVDFSEIIIICIAKGFNIVLSNYSIALRVIPVFIWENFSQHNFVIINTSLLELSLRKVILKQYNVIFWKLQNEWAWDREDLQSKEQ